MRRLEPTAAQLQEMTGCVCFRLRRAARAVTQLYDRALRPLGLRVTQLSVLVGASSREAVELAPLSTALGMDRTTLLRNVRPLVRKKLLTVTTASGTRRTEIRVTPAGRKLLARIYPVWKRTQEGVLRDLDPHWSRPLMTLSNLGKAGRGARS